MCALTEELFERNRHLLGPDDDYWIGQRISRGVKETPGDNLDYHGPNVVLECSPLPLVQRAKLFKEGIRVVIPSHRRVPPDSLTPRAKTHNYLNLIVANQEVQSIDPEAWALLLDVNGNLCEGMGSNIFTVRDGEMLTPREKFVLPGVSRQTVIDLAREEGLTVREADIDLYDAYNADEVFLTSTSLCICPVTQGERRRDRPQGAGVGAGDQAAGRRLPALRRPRFRRPVPQALRRRHGGAGVLKLRQLWQQSRVAADSRSLHLAVEPVEGGVSELVRPLLGVKRSSSAPKATVDCDPVSPSVVWPCCSSATFRDGAVWERSMMRRRACVR